MKIKSGKIIFSYLFFALLGLQSVFAQPKDGLKKNVFNNNKIFEDEFGYVQAMCVNNTIYISGIAAKGEMDSAITKVYERAINILAFYDLTLDHVVKETIYTTQFDSLIQYKEIRKQYYIKGEYPTSTWVQVQRLYSPEAIIEIEFIAITKDTVKEKTKH